MEETTMRLRVPLTLMALTILACSSRLTGNEGNFQFSYTADDRITDFNKPIAVGGYLDIEVTDVGALQPVELLAAAFDDSSVLDVVSFSGSTITVMGVADGSALLSVEGTTVDGETLTDSVNLLAATPEVLLLSHTCEGDTYLTRQRIWVPFEMEKENGQPVIGYGYYPISLDSEASLSLNTGESGQQYMAFDTTATAGTATLSSTVDDASLSINIVTPADITGVNEPVAWVFEDIDVGDTNAFYVLPTTDTSTICQADVAKTVTSDTPEICTVEDAEQLDSSTHEYGWFEVTGVAQGECLFTVTYPTGNSGTGASAQFSYTIEP
jgi:hypothetical protein